MTWDEYYSRWVEVCHQSGDIYQDLIQRARKRTARNTPEEWRWLQDALSDQDRKWFVADVFRFQPIPHRLFAPMLLCGVLEPDPSLNNAFIAPCVRSHGTFRVLSELLRYLESGSDREKAGAASAVYHADFAGNPRNESIADVRQRICWQMLSEFVSNPDIDVRWRIVPMLCLKSTEYPPNLRPLLQSAVEIARSHPDEYIRHRIEIQLGAGGPFMAIPHRSDESG